MTRVVCEDCQDEGRDGCYRCGLKRPDGHARPDGYMDANGRWVNRCEKCGDRGWHYDLKANEITCECPAGDARRAAGPTTAA